MGVSIVLIAGIFVILVAVVSPLIRREIPTTQTIGLALCGLVLVIFTDPGIRNFKCSPSDGCGFERTGPAEGDQIKGIAKSEIDARLEVFGKELSSKFAELNKAIKQLQNFAKEPATLASGAPAAPLPSSVVTAPPPIVSSDDKGTVLVFFRDGQEQRAASVAEILRKSGFKTSSTNSNLKEIQQWATNSTPGFVQVAVAGENSSLGAELRKLLEPVVPKNALSIDTGWNFRASKAQIYLF